MSYFAAAFLFLSSWLALPFVRAASASEIARPDVLFIAVDDLNDWITLLDPAAPIATPNLQRLARRGVSFTRAYTASPACNPSRAAVLTGRSAASTGIYSNTADWRSALPEAMTIPQAFMRAGYRVEGAGKIFHHHFGGAFHDESSFHEFLPMPDPPDAPMPDSKLNQLPGYGTANTDWGAWPEREADAVDVRSVDWCVARLRQSRDQPLFLACGLFRPHMPFFVPPRWLESYPAGQTVLPPIRPDDLADVPAAAKAMLAPSAGRFWQGLQTAEAQNPGVWREAVRHYQAAATFADVQIGRLLDALETTARGRATIVVLWSDHGYQLGEKEAWEKFTLWEKATRVPFIVVVPGITPPHSICERPVSLLDLYPTLAELANLERPTNLDGVSLLPLLRDPSAPRLQPVVMTYLRANHAVRSERWRYIRYANGDEELYDHARDPHEWTNLAGQIEFAPVMADHANWLPRYDAPAVKDMPRPGARNR